MNFKLNNLYAFIMIILWTAGAVLAKGFWLTLLAIFIPFYSWYLIIEKLMMHFGLI